MCDLNLSEHYLLSEYRNSDFKIIVNVFFIWLNNLFIIKLCQHIESRELWGQGENNKTILEKEI